jgi:hypothetical protein
MDPNTKATYTLSFPDKYLFGGSNDLELEYTVELDVNAETLSFQFPQHVLTHSVTLPDKLKLCDFTAAKGDSVTFSECHLDAGGISNCAC